MQQQDYSWAACADQILTNSQIRDERKNGGGKDTASQREFLAVFLDQLDLQSRTGEQIENLSTREESQMRSVKQTGVLITPAAAYRQIVEQRKIPECWQPHAPLA
jgi:hypothetical protein